MQIVRNPTRAVRIGSVTIGDGHPIAVLTMDAQLTESEREALRHAVSAPFLDDQGWRTGTHGEILTERGRTVFKVGFTRAIRKVLGER